VAEERQQEKPPFLPMAQYFGKFMSAKMEGGCRSGKENSPAGRTGCPGRKKCHAALPFSFAHYKLTQSSTPGHA
jgi:hypothetical protein